MEIDFKLEVVKNRFPTYYTQSGRKLDLLVRKTAFSIERRAKMAAPVDTGALRASIYVSTRTNSTYTRRFLRASKLGSAEQMLDEVHPDDKLEAVVGVAAAYGVYVEFGTIKMAARPFFGPAVIAVKPRFVRAVARILGGGND